MLKITYKREYSKEDAKKIRQGLDKHAREECGFDEVEDFALFLHDLADEIVGGCYGIMYYGCLYIDHLWVDEKFRNQRLGTKLVQSAEDLAKQNGCLFSTIDTMDWQALDFYKKLGYEVELERHGYRDDTIMYSLRKDWE